jgi:hypothetical protein
VPGYACGIDLGFLPYEAGRNLQGEQDESGKHGVAIFDVPVAVIRLIPTIRFIP